MAVYKSPQLEEDCTFFIRRSNGKLCADLVPGGDILYTCPSHAMPTQQGLNFLTGKNTEATIIDSLTLYQYHSICYWEFSTTRSMSISTSAAVNLGSVIHCPRGNSFDDMVEIAHCRTLRRLIVEEVTHESHWNTERSIVGQVMADGWTRAVNTKIWLKLSSQYYRFWLSQANHIFTRLQISSDFQDYVFLDHICFTLTISATEADTPTGFLFLCPPEDFQTRQSAFKWPDCPAYWSLDPSGAERLTSEEAVKLGFPSLWLSTEIEGSSWDANVYIGLRRFHQAKGFDSDSQDIARYLGHDLFRLSDSKQIHIPFAHIDDESSNTYDGDPTDEELAKTIESTLMDLDLLTAAAQQDVEEEPVSSAFNFMMIVHLSLILFFALFFGFYTGYTKAIDIGLNGNRYSPS
ncbi:hypothetical protein MSAN_00640200 [Mycena sanguinolenta]|uniref:Uncharacterized protein n=1 Tax=Mycena sanguinolenta TaxID=230812 RepID=A0A8H6Z3N9_9AGAR|nr:hypothetical protein MSAN_00640200 [Mycena sanguinolenta]